MKELTLIRGDDNPITVIVRRPRIDPATGLQATDTKGNPLFDPVSLDGASLRFTARDRTNATVIQLDNSALGGVQVQTPASLGRAIVTVPANTTELFTVPTFLKYDVELYESSGLKTTVARGDAVVAEDESRG